MVEDEEDLRTAIARILREAGYEVREAPDAEAALRLAGEGGAAPDLLVSDIVMPGRSGIELARELRAQRPGLRILLLSGNADHAQASPAERPPGAGFLRKPFQADELRRKVRQALDAPG